MSRTYYVRIDFKKINKYDGGFDKNPIDKIWFKLIKFCGFKQILKVDESDMCNSNEVNYKAHIIMGCSGGTPCQEGVDEIVEIFEKDVPVESVVAYYIEDTTEGEYFADEENL